MLHQVVSVHITCLLSNKYLQSNFERLTETVTKTSHNKGRQNFSGSQREQLFGMPAFVPLTSCLFARCHAPVPRNVANTALPCSCGQSCEVSGGHLRASLGMFGHTGLPCCSSQVHVSLPTSDCTCYKGVCFACESLHPTALQHCVWYSVDSTYQRHSLQVSAGI